ncbi:MAG: tetratricopeptide repeat protein [Pirellulales bacterium]
MDETTQIKFNLSARNALLTQSARFLAAVIGVGLLGWCPVVANGPQTQTPISTMSSSIVAADSGDTAAYAEQSMPYAAYAEQSMPYAAYAEQSMPYAAYAEQSMPYAAYAERGILVSDLEVVKKRNAAINGKSETTVGCGQKDRRMKQVKYGNMEATTNGSQLVIWTEDSPTNKLSAKSPLVKFTTIPNQVQSRGPRGEDTNHSKQSQITAITMHGRSLAPIQPVRHAKASEGYSEVSRAIALEPVDVKPVDIEAIGPRARSSLSTTSSPESLDQAASHSDNSRFTQSITRQSSQSNPRHSSATQTNQPNQAYQPNRQDSALLKAHKISQSANNELDYTQVIRLCARVLRQKTNGEKVKFARELSAWALNRRGQLRTDESEQELAMADFQRALEFAPNHWRALHNRGVTHAQLGRFTEAFDDFNRVIELMPTFAKAYSNRATLYIQAGDLQAALEQFSQSIQLDGNLIAAQVGRGRVCHQLGRLEEALVHFSAAVKLEQDDAQIICSRADLLADMGQYRNAMADYASAIELNPEFAHAYRNGAWLLATCPDSKLRDARNALIGAQRALEFGYGQRHVALDTLAAAQANAGQFDEAIVSLQQALEIAPPLVRQAYEVRMQLYEQQQPFRTTPMAGVQQAGFEETGRNR